MKYLITIAMLLACLSSASEPSKSEKELKQELADLKKNFARAELEVRKKFLRDAKKERPSLSTRDKARLDVIVVEVELAIAQAEIREWIVGIWDAWNSRWSARPEGKWEVKADGTAMIDGYPMKWKIVGETIVFEDKHWSGTRHWCLVEMLGKDSALVKKQDGGTRSLYREGTKKPRPQDEEYQEEDW